MPNGSSILETVLTEFEQYFLCGVELNMHCGVIILPSNFGYEPFWHALLYFSVRYSVVNFDFKVLLYLFAYEVFSRRIKFFNKSKL